METLAVVVLAAGLAALAAAALVLARGSDPAAVRALESQALSLGQIQGDLTALARRHEDLRLDVQRLHSESALGLSQAAAGIRAEVGQARTALAEVKALEQVRASSLNEAAARLRRLEAVLAGSATRGAAGENILARALGQLPPDLIEVNVAFGGRVVEYALRLPAGRLLPIDSKWTSVEPLARLEASEDPQERRQLVEQISRELATRAREMAKYLDPERTAALAILAVPDAVHSLALDVQVKAYREGVLIVPYSLALPYVLALLRLANRFSLADAGGDLARRLTALGESLRRMDEEVEGRLSRALVQAENARDALRDGLALARRQAELLVSSAEAEPLATDPV
jgi:DNA recombination protein RmuC